MIYETFLKCRTVRRFKRVQAPNEKQLHHLIECVRLAPSAANLQRLRYKLITGESADKMYSAIAMGGYLKDEENHDSGFGSCMIRSFSREKISDLTQAENYFPNLVLALGVPDECAEVAELSSDGDIKYYHNADGKNIVPKRSVEELIIK